MQFKKWLQENYSKIECDCCGEDSKPLYVMKRKDAPICEECLNIEFEESCQVDNNEV